jgi:thioredoxin reductase
MDSLALRPEQRQHLGRLRPSRTEPMRRASVEFGHLAGLHDEVVLAQSQPQAAGQNVHPLVTRYGSQVETSRVTALSRDGDRFRVRIGSRAVTARRLLVATGVRDELPDVPGLAARWGIDVLHCPYCHGWEVRDQRIGILATGPAAVHQALLFSQLSAHVTLLQHTGPKPTGEQREQLDARGIAVTDGPVEAVEAGPEGLTGVRLAGGRQLSLDAIVVAPRLHARAELLVPLGLQPAELRQGEQLIGTYIEADLAGATKVPGVWVAGNLAQPMAQVMAAASAGLTAGAAINYDLILEETSRAVKDKVPFLT